MSSLSLSSPTMSDKTLLLSVEDLICMAMGPREGNTVNFKVIQSVLHILARQMRLLEQKVVLVAGEPPGKRSPRRSRVSKADMYRRRSEGRGRGHDRDNEERESRGRSGGRHDIDDEEHGGRGRSGGRHDIDDEERGGRGRSGGRHDIDDEERGGRSRSSGRHDIDDEERGGRGRSGGRHDIDDEEHGGRSRSGGRHDIDDGERGGRGRSGGRHDIDDEERGGHGRSGGRIDDEERVGRGRTGGRHDIDDEERGGRGRSDVRHGIDDEERGGRGRSGGRHDIDDEERGGRGRSGGRHDIDGEERGGRGRSGGRHDVGDEERGGRGRSGGRHDIDDEERGVRGRSDGRNDIDDKERGGRGGPGGRHDRDDDERKDRSRSGGRGVDKYDEGGEGRAGRGRDAERYDEERGGRDGRREGEGRDRSGGGRGADRYDERDGLDRSAGGRGRDIYVDEDQSSVRSGADRDEHGRQARGRSVRPGGRYSDDQETGGRGAGGPGAGGRDGIDKKGARQGGGFEGETDDRMKDGGRGGADRGGRGRDDAYGGHGPGARGGRDETERGGKQGIGVREIEGPGKEKVLVVGKGPAPTGNARDRDGIAVVTQSQFQLLEGQVEELWRVAGPPPPLALPDNLQLRKELAAGASLTDAMQAMQVSARVQAAEQAIMRLGGLLTHLAASGALPPDAADAVMATGWADEDEVSKTPRATGTGVTGTGITGAGVTGKDSSAAGRQFVTKSEMGVASAKVRDEVAKALQAHIDKASAAADHAERTAKSVGEKVDELLKMDKRLSELHSMVEDYTSQLTGFDAGLTTQMDSFKEQMATMRSDLQAGLEQLQLSNANPETAAVLELNERFEGLVRGLEDTLLQHTALSNMQHQLTQELKTLVGDVETLRDQKADRDELLDILRDKADVSMLDGLVRLEEFERAQQDLQRQLDKCNDKFQKQDQVWMGAISDLQEQAESKAQLADLMKLRGEATEQLRSIEDRFNRLALVLGEPKAAMLMRALARDAVCGACLTPAMMLPGEPPQPPALPAAAARGHAPPASPCAPEPGVPDYPDFRTHRCHRWVGGSHTLLPAARAHAALLEVTEVTKKYTGYGDDGRLYWMETQLEPCVECNVEPTPAPPVTARVVGAGAGGGDAGGELTDVCEC